MGFKNATCGLLLLVAHRHYRLRATATWAEAHELAC